MENEKTEVAKYLGVSEERLNELRDWAWNTILESKGEQDVMRKLLEKCDSMSVKELIHTAMKLGSWALIRGMSAEELVTMKMSMNRSVMKGE